MAQLAVFIDGGYAAKLAAQHLHVWIDYEKLSNAIRDRIAEKGCGLCMDLGGTYASELWELADDRIAVGERDFMNEIQRVRRA